MKMFTLTQTRMWGKLLVSLRILFFTIPQTQAQFSCLSLAYLIQGSETGVYAVDLASGQYADQVGALIPGNKLNAIGYDPVNGYIWAFNMTTNQLVKYDGNWGDEDLYTVSGLSATGVYVGDVSDNGEYYLYKSNTLHVVDVSSGTPVFRRTISCFGGNIHDIAFNPIDGNIYTVEKGSNQIKRIHPGSGNVTNLGSPSVMSSENSAYGGVFFDASGDFYASSNNTGKIYRINSVQNLSGATAPNAYMFAYGPSSGNNDGTKCPMSEISTEGCANFLDDNEDEDVDCDDVECNGNIACRVGGGGNAGLETNGGLSEKIAYRDFIHARYNVDLDDKAFLPKVDGMLVADPSLSDFFRNDFSIEEFVPVDAIPETETYESTPTDLVGLSNAVQVASIDAYKGNYRVGAVLAIKSENAVYEHSKYVCDRVKGTEIHEILTKKLDGENDFNVTYFKNPDNGREYGTLFSAYLNEDNNFVVESHWSTYAYPKQDNYYNFQIWANSIKKLEYLVQETLHNLSEKAPIAEIHSTAAPRVFIRDHDYENGQLRLIVDNRAGARSLKFNGVEAQTETSTRENVSFDIPLNGNPMDTVLVPMQFYTLGGTLTYDENESVDQIYVGNGSWGLNYDKNASTINTYEISRSSAPDKADEESWIERNVRIKGTLNGDLTIFRTIQNAARPRDFSKYNTLSFEIEGTSSIEVVLIKAGISNWAAQPRVTINTEGQCQRVYLSKADFDQPDGNFEWQDIKSISFIKSANGAPEAFELEIRDVAFMNLNAIPECESFNKQAVTAFPNPMKDVLNIKLGAGGHQEFSVYLFNQVGQVVGQGTGISDDRGVIKFVRPGLIPGMYTYRVDLVSGSYSGKVLVD